MTDRGTEYLSGRGITPDTAKRFGLVYDAERDAVAIPYVSALGDIVQVRLRQLSREPKYLDAKNAKDHLFNVVDVDTPGVYICEGEFDAIILKQLGKAAVAIAGVKRWHEEWRWLFHGNPHVRIVTDGDEEGRDVAKLIRRNLSRHVEQVDVVNMPPNRDVTDLFLSGDLEEVLAE